MQAPHPLATKVLAVARRARMLVLLEGLGWFLATTVSAAFLAGLVDYLVRSQDPAVRFAGSAAVVSVAGWCLYRFLYPALAYRPTLLQVAQRIELYFPRLEGRLSSSLDFLVRPADDVTAGSVELRRVVVSETSGEVDSLDLARCLDGRSLRRAAFVAAALALTFTLICLWDVGGAALAARRLAAPWSGERWPQRHVLVFDPPVERMAAGQDFEVMVVDRNGRLPDVVHISYWFEGDAESQIQQREMRPMGDRRMVHHLDNVTRPFKYRATGGDDSSMNWIQLELVEPPRVVAHETRIYSPDYTAWPVQLAETSVRALEGSRIEVQGKVSKPLSSIRLNGDRVVEDVPVTLNESGTEFSILASSAKPWRVSESGSYWFELVDREGLKGDGGLRWEIRAARDLAPTVSLDKPAANAFVTAGAVVPLTALVKDDLAIQAIELRISRSDRSEEGERAEQLFLGPPVAGPLPPGQSPFQGERGESRLVEYLWDLSQLADLSPGVWLDFHVAASDYKPQWGQSSPRRLTIISAEELEDRVAQRRSQILGQIAEVLRIQRESRSQTAALEIQLREAGQLVKKDIDHLQSAELSQRQVGQLLADPDSGVTAQILGLLADLEHNRVDSSDAGRRMTELVETLTAIHEQHQLPIQSELTSALKVAREHLDDIAAANRNAVWRQAFSSSIERVAGHQDQVIAALEQLLGELTQWDNYRRFAREITHLRADQQQLNQQTLGLQAETLTKREADLTGQQRADLMRSAQQQLELARRFDRLQSRMQQTRDELRQSDPLASETLADTLDSARRQAFSGQMRDAARHIEDNRIGQAVEQQQEVAEGLRELLDILANQRDHELERVARKLKEGAAALEQIRQQQGELSQEFQSAQGVPEPERPKQLGPLGQQQEDLAGETQRLARQLRRLQARLSSESTGRASSDQQQAAQAGKRGEADSALDHARRSEQRLDEAQRQLAEEIGQVERELVKEQFARLEEQITALMSRQQSVTSTTEQIEELREGQGGGLPHAQQATVRQLARDQRLLATETGWLAGTVARSAAFELGLQGAMHEMLRAASGLDRLETGDETSAAQQAAIARLRQFLTALEPGGDSARQATSASPPPPESPPRAGQDVLNRLAELKLLKLMQEEINRRTIELEQQGGRNEKSAGEQTLRLEELAAEQGKLADLIFRLISAAESGSGPQSPPAADLPGLEGERKGS